MVSQSHSLFGAPLIALIGRARKDMKETPERLKICLTCAAGGHLTQAIEISQHLRKEHDAYFITHRMPHINGKVSGLRTYFVVNPHLSYVKYVINLFQSLPIFFKERPDVVISTGAGNTIPTCLLAKMFGAKLIYVESGSRTKNPSRTGRFLYHFADLFIVQWPSVKWAYPKAVVGGPLI
jgi:beta-1,4-N-acetylglucosaminyltransferase